MANNYGAFAAAVPPFLNIVDFAHRLVGPKPLEYISGAMNRVSNHMVPTWNPYMPRVSASIRIYRFRVLLLCLHQVVRTLSCGHTHVDDHCPVLACTCAV